MSDEKKASLEAQAENRSHTLGLRGEGTIGEAKREKYWTELSIEEKIERMRGEVKNMKLLMVRMFRVEQNFAAHQHSVTGQIMLPFDRYGGESETSMQKLQNDLYF